MTDAELDDLEAKAKAATQGPWHRSGDSVIQTAHVTRDVWFIPKAESDVDYIAAANPATVLALIAEVRQLQDKNAWLLRWAPAEDECQTPGGCTRENCGGDCDY